MTLTINDIAQKHIGIQTGQSYHNASLSDFLHQNKSVKEEYVKFIEDKLDSYQKDIDSYNQFLSYLIDVNSIKIDKLNVMNIEKDQDNNYFINISISDNTCFYFSLIFSKGKNSYYGEDSKIRMLDSSISLKSRYSGSSVTDIELFLEKYTLKETDITRSLITAFLDKVQYNSDFKNKINQIKDIGRTLFKILSNELFEKKIPLDLLVGENLLTMSAEKMDLIGLEKDIDLKNNINDVILKINDYNSKINTISKKNTY